MATGTNITAVDALTTTVAVSAAPTELNLQANDTEILISRKPNTSKGVSTEAPLPKILTPRATSKKKVINGDVKPKFSGYIIDNQATGLSGAQLINQQQQDVAKQSAIYKRGKEALTQKELSNFYLTYFDSKGTKHTFIFSLMPAIENSLRSNNNGMAVPEVKPGIFFRTDINTKKMNIPGAPPIFQSLNIDKTILQITAALLGNEQVLDYNSKNDKANNDSLYKSTNVRGNEIFGTTGAFGSGLNKSKSFKALEAAIFLDTKVVQTGRPLTLTLVSDVSKTDPSVKINLRCLIQSYRYLGRYTDKVFVALDILLLDYLDVSAIKNIHSFNK